jgi:PBP4 family serine-type D-alanyl-D-alanine carboxypeptidase
MIVLKRKFLVGMTLLGLCGAFAVPTVYGGANRTNGLAGRIQQIISRPVFRHAGFGIEFYSLDKDTPIYALNSEKLFTPASTTKLLTEGIALMLLGTGYRFRTPVYRTGSLDPDGTLHGDLVLVASGDPNISQRIQPDGTLTFENDDHCYGGPPIPGDPLVVIKQLAQEVALHGIRQVDGRVLVDTTLFPEGAKELGTGTVISPMVLNDNIIDVSVAPGPAVAAPVIVRVSPATSYAQFVNHAVTGRANSRAVLQWSKDAPNPDGSHAVTLSGSLPLGSSAVWLPYDVPQPSRFAEMAFMQALGEQGITVAGDGGGPPPDFKTLAHYYVGQNLVAQHVSPTLSQDAKVTLKVSQNLHASVMPYILGAIVSRASENMDQAGFDLERDFLSKAALDVTEASQSDGAGGSRAAFFAPDFMVHYLAYMARQKVYPQFLAGLPVLGRDGTLVDIQRHSLAAGHVFAKTGTYDVNDLLNRDEMVTGKGLAGYLTTPKGEHLAFAVYANNVSVPNRDDSIDEIVGQALGEIAAAAYMQDGRQ